MQIGNTELDTIYAQCIAPVLRLCGLDPRRVDKHTEGRLLKSEIVGFIESSDIIVADLTNERPNCYLEIGYAMGLDKFSNLLLTAREDHNADSPNFLADRHKIHFDLSGYDILFWNPKELDRFKQELEKRIRRRLTIIQPMLSIAATHWDDQWIAKHREIALNGLSKTGKKAFMELKTVLRDIKTEISQSELLRSARESQIETFGWPIGIVLDRPEFNPRPTTDGIIAEILVNEPGTRPSYDYWTLRKSGDYYLLKSLFEDERKENAIFFNTRIMRITETLLHMARLYSSLNIARDAYYLVGVKHGGLQGRVMTVSSIADRMPPHSDTESKEDEVYTEVVTNIEETESELVDLVDKFAQELFVIFNYFQVNKGILEDIVNKFVQGKDT